MLTAFMCENAVGPICPALEQFADETANLPAHRFRPFMRIPAFSGVGFLFILFLKRSKIDISRHLKFFLPMHWAQDTTVAQSMPD